MHEKVSQSISQARPNSRQACKSHLAAIPSAAMQLRPASASMAMRPILCVSPKEGIGKMPLASILVLKLDHPPMTAQQLADQALIADREARRLARAGDYRAEMAQAEANAIADECARRARDTA